MSSSADTLLGGRAHPRKRGVAVEREVAADPREGQHHSPAVSPSEGGMPIAWLLPLVLTALVLVAVIPVALLGYLGARDNTDRLMRDRSERSCREISIETEGGLFHL